MESYIQKKILFLRVKFFHTFSLSFSLEFLLEEFEITSLLGNSSFGLDFSGCFIDFLFLLLSDSISTITF